MTLASAEIRVAYYGNSVKTEFPVPFRFLDDEHLFVSIMDTTTGTETTQVLTTDYTLFGANSPQGGTLTMVTAPTAAEKLTIIRNVPVDQLVNLREGDTFSANRNEYIADKLTMLIQQVDEETARSVILKKTTDLTGVDVEDLHPQASGFTAVFPAQITAAEASPNVGAYTFTEQTAGDSGTFNDRAGGISDMGWPLPHCLTGWESDLPLYVIMHVHEDEDGNIRYVFIPPPPCNTTI